MRTTFQTITKVHPTASRSRKKERHTDRPHPHTHTDTRGRAWSNSILKDLLNGADLSLRGGTPRGSMRLIGVYIPGHNSRFGKQQAPAVSEHATPLPPPHAELKLATVANLVHIEPCHRHESQQLTNNYCVWSTQAAQVRSPEPSADFMEPHAPPTSRFHNYCEHNPQQHGMESHRLVQIDIKSTFQVPNNNVNITHTILAVAVVMQSRAVEHLDVTFYIIFSSPASDRELVLKAKGVRQHLNSHSSSCNYLSKPNVLSLTKHALGAVYVGFVTKYIIKTHICRKQSSTPLRSGVHQHVTEMI